MSLNGSISTESYEGRIYTLSWSATQSIEKNQSTISWTLSCSGGPAWIAERTLYAALAGKVLIDKTARVERYAGTIDNGSFTVDHDVEGKYSFTGGMSVAIFGSSVNRTASGSFTLDQIPRQAKITSVSDFNDITNPTVYFNHPAGNALELQACIMSGDTQITSYRRISAEDIAKGSYTFNLKEVYDDGTTPESRIWARSIEVGSDTIDVTFRLATWLGTSFGYTTSEIKKCTVTDCAPILSPIVKDLGTNSTRLTGPDSDKIIKGHNYVEVATGAVGVKGATIVSRSISCAGTTIYKEHDYMNNVEGGTFVFTATDNRGKTTTVTVTKELIPYTRLTCITGNEKPNVEGDYRFIAYGSYFDGSFGAVNNSLKVEWRYAVKGEDFPKDDSGNYIWNSFADVDLVDGNYIAYQSIAGLEYTTTYVFQARAADEVYTGYIESTEISIKTQPVFDWSDKDFKFNVPFHASSGFSSNGDSSVKGNFNVTGTSTFDGNVNVTGATDIFGDLYNKGNPVGYYPIGGIYTSDNDTNPGTLFGGTWELMRNFHGGELVAYGTASNAYDSDVPFDTASYHGISDIFGGGNVVLNLHNHIPDIFTFNSGAIWAQTKGIVGLVEAEITLSGVSDAYCYGIWFRSSNQNPLPTAVVLTGGGGIISITKGNYTGASHKYFYNVADSDTDTGFYVNPSILAYGGVFNPCRHGTLSVIQVKAFAKGGTTYMWKRIA